MEAAFAAFQKSKYQPVAAAAWQCALCQVTITDTAANRAAHVAGKAHRKRLAAAATPDECTRPLFRGIRGNLPESFWTPDAKQLICATEMAFMSTSLGRTTPIEYMARGQQNVLWELVPSTESDGAFHCGADISCLSQYQDEREVLFPPCTMLIVRARGPGEEQAVDGCTDDARSERVAKYQVGSHTEGEKHFTSVGVVPYFV